MSMSKEEKSSEQWEQLKQARASFRATIVQWCNLDKDTKRNDLLLALNETAQQQRMVADFLQSTDLWDKEAVAVVCHELVDESLNGHEEISGWTKKALCKLEYSPLCSQIVEDIWKISKRADKSDWSVFHNAYLLLYWLGCKDDLLRYIEYFRTEIGENEISERDLKDFENMPDKQLYYSK